MQNKSDAQLLGEYAAQHSDPAFAEIVARHTDLVYSAALRQTGSPELAREIAQSVFTDLARKARALADTLSADASLAGWLFRSTRFAGLKWLRDDHRRQDRERQFMEHFNLASQAGTESAPDWERVAPVLDEAMAELDDADHEAVLLRYFKNQDFHAVGLALGVSDDTAQKRVSRAIERLRGFFAKRGVTVGASGLVVVVSANAVQAAPAGLAATLTTASLASAAAGTGITLTLLKFMIMTKLKLTVAGALLAVILIPVTVWQVNEYRSRKDPADDQWKKWFQVMYSPQFRNNKVEQLEQLKTMIDQGADVNMAIGFDRMTRANLRGTSWPLDAAVHQARIDMVKLLLDSGAKIRGKELAAAAFAGNQDESLAMVTALIEAGADVNSPDPDYSHTALFWASAKGNKNSVKLLLAQPGIKLDAINTDGNTALMAAAEHGHTEIVEMLLKAGANVSITNKRGETAAALASRALAKQQAIVEKQQAIISNLPSPPK